MGSAGNVDYVKDNLINDVFLGNDHTSLFKNLKDSNHSSI